MLRLSKYIPSIKSLEMLLALSKYRSVSEAAKAANVTQPAVSKQIRLLEDRFGFRIFVRRRSGLSLTPEGQRLLEAIQTGFGQITGTIDRINKIHTVPSVTIQTDAEFASNWLLPVIKAFNQVHPKMNTSIFASTEPPDFRNRDVDIGIPFGDGNWTGCQCTRLFYEEVYPVCSPEYLSQNPTLTKIDDLRDMTLLSMSHPNWIWMDWDEWFERAGHLKLFGKQLIKFNEYNVAHQAAVNGQGVALGWKYLTDPLLASGQLVRPLKEFVTSDRGQFITLSSLGDISENTQVLHDWIVDHARARYLLQ